MRMYGSVFYKSGKCLAVALAVAFFALYGLRAQMASPFGLQALVVDVSPELVYLRVTLDIPGNHVIYAETLTVSADTDKSLHPVKLPPGIMQDDPAEPGRKVAVYKQRLESLWRWDTEAPRGEIAIAFQGCDEQTCFMPEEHRFIFNRSAKTLIPAGEAEGGAETALSGSGSWTDGYALHTSGGYMGVDEFLAFLDQAQGKAVPADNASLTGFLRDPVVFFHRYGLWLTLLLVLIGGALLNLTPCVLPMVPVTLGIIGAGAGTSRKRGFGLGAAYGGGIVLVYGGLGWLILRSGLFFGALQASPWFNLAVALVFALLTLALFDVFMIDLTRFMGEQSSGRKGLLAAFSAGAVAALLAGACVAPVVLAVLLLAGTLYAGGASGAQFLPFVLGLGMALPWPLAGAGLSVMPRPGAWMVRVKQVFGLLLAVLTIYYAYLAFNGFRSHSHVAHGDSILAGDKSGWAARVAQARRERKPLFVDFWATWCKNCAVMERTTFADERVKARLAEYVVVKVQAEQPGAEGAREMLQAFDIKGLPGFVVLRDEP